MKCPPCCIFFFPIATIPVTQWSRPLTRLTDALPFSSSRFSCVLPNALHNYCAQTVSSISFSESHGLTWA